MTMRQVTSILSITTPKLPTEHHVAGWHSRKNGTRLCCTTTIAPWGRSSGQTDDAAVVGER